MQSNSWITVALAVFVAPIVASAVWCAVYAAFVPYQASDSTLDWWPSWQIYMIETLMVGFAGTLIVGVPLHTLLTWKRWTQWWAYVVAAALGGAAAAIALILVTPNSWGYLGSTLLAGTSWAALIGLIAWLIRRPDRDAPPNPPTSTA
jgi:hypothetical protein